LTVTITYERDGLITQLEEHKRESVRRAPGLVQFRLKAFHEQDHIWEYEGSTGRIIPEQGRDLSQDVLKALDMCGASELTSSFSGYRDEKKLEASNWKTWFLEKASMKYLIPDTNFVYRHYCSNVLARHLGEDFSNLIFRLPRLAILEIERRGNNAQEGSADKRLSFYAAREVRFLRSNINFDLLPNIDTLLFSTFSEKAGKKLVDMWIRKEIHDFVGGMGGYTNVSPKEVVFLTCDLMNALAAESEGLNTCYFSKEDQQSFFVDSDNMQQLFDLIFASTMILGKIRIDIVLTDDVVHKSFTLEGIWNGKTTSQWYSDCIKATYG
jgi:hypothetical protein